MRKRWGALVTAAVTAGALVTGWAPAKAATGSLDQAPPAPVGEFYTPPDPLPAGNPGDVIRSEPMPLALALPDGSSGKQMPASATRVMYRSEDTHDQPTAVTGTYLEPSAPWTGPGPRPVVVVAPSTQGQGDQCAPSKLLQEGFHYRFPLDVTIEYEYATVFALASRGIAVMMTDYHGLGTPAMHDYLNRKAEAHAVLDAGRAAKRLPGTSLRPESKVGISGYSQGGGAGGAAVELQPEYAPDLPLSGTYLIAPPANLQEVVHAQAFDSGPFGRGGIGVGAIGYIANGMRAEYPEARAHIDAALNDQGRQLLQETSTTCLPEMGLRYLYRNTGDFTVSGRSIFTELLSTPQLKPYADEQMIGTHTPASPVLIANSVADDVVPWGQARQLAVDWCTKGAKVQLQREDIPWVLPSTAIGHILDWVPALANEGDWFVQRLSGVDEPGNCAALPA